MHQNFLVQAIKNLKKAGSFRRKVAAYALALYLKNDHNHVLYQQNWITMFHIYNPDLVELQINV